MVQGTFKEQKCRISLTQQIRNEVATFDYFKV